MAVELTGHPVDELRYFPIDAWIRARHGGKVIVDSRRAVLVWPPNHPFPSYGFPPEDVRAPARPIDGLEQFVTLPWDAADEWLEEEETLVGHARDPFKRIDVRQSSRQVVVRHEGEVLADSSRPVLLFERPLPTRYYLPPDDVRLDLLEPSETRTTCAYKGHAEHYAHRGTDVAWVYREPLPDMQKIKGLVCFYNERVDIEVDGELEKLRWSPFR